MAKVNVRRIKRAMRELKKLNPDKDFFSEDIKRYKTCIERIIKRSNLGTKDWNIEVIKEIIGKIISASEMAKSRRELEKMLNLKSAELEILLNLMPLNDRKRIKRNIINNNEREKIQMLEDASKNASSIIELAQKTNMSEGTIRKVLDREKSLRKQINERMKKNGEAKLITRIIENSKNPSMLTLKELACYEKMSYSRLLSLMERFPNESKIIKKD